MQILTFLCGSLLRLWLSVRANSCCQLRRRVARHERRSKRERRKKKRQLVFPSLLVIHSFAYLFSTRYLLFFSMYLIFALPPIVLCATLLAGSSVHRVSVPIYVHTPYPFWNVPNVLLGIFCPQKSHERERILPAR